ncbi:MAG: ferritin [Candidatus Eisenbacteria bacterium]|nr:ferritin [Candidatus Eisenbacteria bacterium]
MLISKAMNKALNEQIGDELQASNQYVAIATYFDSDDLGLLAGFFYKQAEEEREHAMKLVKYVVEAGGKVNVPAIGEPKNLFKSAEEAVKLALDWEMKVTDRINRLVDLAIKDNDHLSRGFLNWFVQEQLEEVSSMSRMLHQVRRAGPNLLTVEAYLIHGK